MAEARLRIQFEDMGQQTHAARLGMWLVLISEVLLFSGLFALYTTYRVAHPHLFAEAVRHTSLWMGTLMTYILITSSLLVAMGVHAARRGASRTCSLWLGSAVLLGVVFLVLKGWEYSKHIHEGIRPGAYYAFDRLPEGGAQVFFTLYYLMTGLHAIHVIVGAGVLAVLAWQARRGAYGAAYHTPVELGGMYWHLVDIIWVFLWPMFYLMH